MICAVVAVVISCSTSMTIRYIYHMHISLFLLNILNFASISNRYFDILGIKNKKQERYFVDLAALRVYLRFFVCFFALLHRSGY